jgi:hypothetical protein
MLLLAVDAFIAAAWFDAGLNSGCLLLVLLLCFHGSAQHTALVLILRCASTHLALPFTPSLLLAGVFNQDALANAHACTTFASTTAHCCSCLSSCFLHLWQTHSQTSQTYIKLSTAPPGCGVQEFCDQGTLANLAATKWLPEQEGDEQMLRRLVLLRDAARGLQALHAACVVHGDLVGCCSCCNYVLLYAMGGSMCFC